MDRAVIRDVCQRLVSTDSLSERVVVHASSLLLQSVGAISLKSTEEPARVYICCFLAIERLAVKYDLPEPKLERPPLPPTAFNKLKDRFKAVLLNETSAPATPTKKRRIESETPVSEHEKLKHTPTRSPSKTASPSPRNTSLFKGIISSPRKRRNQLPKVGELEKIASMLDLKSETTRAILHAFELYRGLVKDDWGLMLALILVLIERAEPQEDLKAKLVGAATKCNVSDPAGRIEEWEQWARKVVTGQTWVNKISVVPEALPTLCGSAGSWGSADPQLIPFE